MGAVNVLLFMLVLIIITVSKATGSDPCSLTCKHVTGSVGEKLTLTCHVWHRSNCCIKLYKFKYAEDDSDSEICRNESTTCEQRTKLTCPYTSNERRTAKVMFFLQTESGQTSKYFTVNITAPKTEESKSNKDQTNNNEETPNEEGYKSKLAVLIAAVSSFIVIIIIIMVAIHKKMKCNCNNHSGL